MVHAVDKRGFFWAGIRITLCVLLVFLPFSFALVKLLNGLATMQAVAAASIVAVAGFTISFVAGAFLELRIFERQYGRHLYASERQWLARSAALASLGASAFLALTVVAVTYLRLGSNALSIIANHFALSISSTLLAGLTGLVVGTIIAAVLMYLGTRLSSSAVQQMSR